MNTPQSLSGLLNIINRRIRDLETRPAYDDASYYRDEGGVRELEDMRDYLQAMITEGYG